MNQLVQLAEDLKYELGKEYDEWRFAEERGVAPDHERQWHAIRLLILASEHGGIRSLTRDQLRCVQSYVNIGPRAMPKHSPSQAA